MGICREGMIVGRSGMLFKKQNGVAQPEGKPFADSRGPSRYGDEDAATEVMGISYDSNGDI